MAEAYLASDKKVFASKETEISEEVLHVDDVQYDMRAQRSVLKCGDGREFVVLISENIRSLQEARSKIQFAEKMFDTVFASCPV